MPQTSVLEYKCPCCDAKLNFGQDSQKLECAYCGNSFEIEAVEEYNKLEEPTQEEFQWEESTTGEWSAAETQDLQNFSCPACGGEILSDEHTVASFCPYCDNPAILPGRVSGGLKPDAVIPFKTSKEDAQNAFRTMCKGKPLLPKNFASEQRVEKITGIYVPFWLYDCSGDQASKYRCTRVRHWSDSRYHYTKTDHYLANRAVKADFVQIPMDGSSKMDDAIMESIEPFDYSQMVDFDTAYLSGFFADKYDVASKDGEQRIRQRVSDTLDSEIRSSLIGYTSTINTEKHLDIRHSKAKYVLFPVWMLHSKYKDKTYTFAMNGQTGKMTGTLPICPKRSTAWFFGIFAAAFTVISLLTLLI